MECHLKNLGLTHGSGTDVEGYVQSLLRCACTCFKLGACAPKGNADESPTGVIDVCLIAKKTRVLRECWDHLIVKVRNQLSEF